MTSDEKVHPKGTVCLTNKSKLQEFAQKRALALPSYETIYEGAVHAPRCRSTVTVDGQKFTSPNTFPNRRAAEQDVSNIALEFFSTHQPDTTTLLSQIQDTALFKSILNEYAARMGLPSAVYLDSEADGNAVPVAFFSTVLFNGKKYTGPSGSSKKVAEQLGALTVIDTILGESSSRDVMSQVISKKLASKLKSKESCSNYLGIVKGMSCVLPAHESADDPVLQQVQQIAVGPSTGGSCPTVDHGLQQDHANEVVDSGPLAIPKNHPVPVPDSCKIVDPDPEQNQHIMMVPEVHGNEGTSCVKKKRKRKKKKDVQNQMTEIKVESQSVPVPLPDSCKMVDLDPEKNQHITMVPEVHGNEGTSCEKKRKQKKKKDMQNQMAKIKVESQSVPGA